MSTHEICSEIAGSVLKVQVNPGDKVDVDDEILVIESMKMEIPVLADQSGIVESVKVEQGTNVAEGQVVAVISTDTEAA